MAEDDSGGSLTVPKFSSFKSKESSIVSNSSQSEKRQYEERRSDRGSHRSKKHHHSRHHRHGSGRAEARRSSSSRDIETKKHAEMKALPERSSVPSLFVTDVKGDRLISKYGGIDRAQVPPYYRHGAGRVLGTPGRLVIHRDAARDKFSLRFPGEGLGIDKDGLRSKSLRLNRDPVRLRAKGGNAQNDTPEDFLVIRQTKKRKRNQLDSDSPDDDDQLSYRSIEGKAKAKRAVDSDTDDGSDASEEVTDLQDDSPLQWKSIQLNRRVKEEPGDIDAWLELVNHQDDLLRAGETIDQRSTESTAHSYSEIKVSMLESALSNVSSADDRRKVLIYLMREGMKVWTSKTATKKWAEVAVEEPDNFELWIAHLDFSLSNISTVQYDEIKTMLLTRLRQAISRNALSSEHDASEAIYVFLRATRFFHDAGYKELAVASWQGLLELNYFKPVSEHANMDAFQDFWESEVPRTGDDDAHGWRQYSASGGQMEAPEPRNEPPLERLATRDAYKAWAYSEKEYARRAILPARTMDDGTEDDPFRVVMFSDIEPWLFKIPEAVLRGTVGSQLLDAFLLFCKLPPAFRSSSWTDMAIKDQFIFDGSLDLDSFTTPSQLEDITEVERKPPAFGIGSLNVAISPDVLFAGNWFNYFASVGKYLPVELGWVLNVIRQLVHEADVSSLALYYLSLTHHSGSGSIKKAARAILKKYPNASELYNAYALAEFADQSADVAAKVITTSLASASLSTGSSGFELFKSWSWMELEQGSKNLAVARLCAVVDESLRKISPEMNAVSPTTILKTRQHIAASAHQYLYEGKHESATPYAEASALLSYLTEERSSEPTSAAQGNINAAMATIKGISNEFKSRGYSDTRSHERILQFGAKILYFHSRHGPFRRVYLRDQLSQFLGYFPSNTMFLSLSEWADSSLRVIDETRQLLYNKVLIKGVDCVSSRVFSINHELSRGNANSTKAAFEHTLSQAVCQSNVGLWVSYIRLCYRQKTLRSKAKDTFYRALRHCPQSKDVMMEAFATLIREMTSDELRAVHNTMMSKALRIHVDLDEFTEQWRQGKQSSA